MNELRTLIDLCPGIRLPQNEAVIFSDKELAGYYLIKLCERLEWYTRGDSVPSMAYFYTKFVMKCRWPEAEAVIATSPRWAYYYASDVFGDRWPEAEAVIASDSLFRGWYNHEFGTNI